MLGNNGLVYLDSAATALKPISVIDAVTSYYRDHYGTVHRAVYDLALLATQEYSTTREKAAQFLNAASIHEIVFTKGTTDGINLIAFSFGKAFVTSGDEIIVSAMEHHANLVPWQIMAKERGAILKVIPMDQRGVLDLDKFEQMLTSKTKLVAVAHISNALGTENDINRIIQAAHRVKAKVLIDAAQSISHIPIDVQALDVDFLVFSSHKLFGPTGVGILYGKQALLDALPPYQSGGDMIETVTLETATFQKAPLRFEAGTPPIASVIGLGKALDYINRFGLKSIGLHEQQLLYYATQRLEQISEVTILGTAPRKGPIITFIIKNLHPLDVGSLLNAKGIAVRTGHLCAQPALAHFGCKAAIRVSLAPYNQQEDIDNFLIALESSISELI